MMLLWKSSPRSAEVRQLLVPSTRVKMDRLLYDVVNRPAESHFRVS